MRRKGNLYCKCQHYQSDHIIEKTLPNKKKTRMGCMSCQCLKFEDDRKFAGVLPDK